MAKNKFYVVWKGLNPGIYDNWAECKAQVDGQEGAKYKSFENRGGSRQSLRGRLYPLPKDRLFPESRGPSRAGSPDREPDQRESCRRRRL